MMNCGLFTPSPGKMPLSAIILAGGRSTRMGEDKALLSIDKMPLLKRTCLCAQAVASQVYIVTPWQERYQGIVPEGCEIIPEVGSPQGPLAGLYQGLQKQTTEWVLALACDLPKLTVSELQFWCEQLPTLSPEEVAFLPRSPQGWEPLCGFYHQQCERLFAQYLETGKRSFQGFLSQHPVQELKVRDRAVLFNCNTPEDWAQLNSL
jgi:molybdopterin-guanine dinucleotide biosynthesis protein A